MSKSFKVYRGQFKLSISGFGYKKLKFINYVGVIALDNLVIEILPKISLSGEVLEDRKVLLFMLSKCRKINIKNWIL
ncbi:hypothetical protein FZ989_05960 [Clostridium perfringens]|nr:hypothetical protein [Clostridium perfringens]